MGDKAEKAGEYFLKGANCSQAVLAAFHEDLNLDLGTALKLASSFGGGMGRMREVCGVLSSAFMILGLLYGYAELENPEAKAAHYKLIQDFAKKFRELNGSILCRELLGLDEPEHSFVPEERTQSYYEDRPCLLIVRNTADQLENYINEKMKGTEK
jgi:C_GCAxxG_C_C family probable redox protein